MTASPEFALSEAGGVQLQALTTLSNLGWRYLPRAEADRLRGSRRDAILGEIARAALGRINRFEQGGEAHRFNDAGLAEGLGRLADLPFEGLLATNEKATDLLLLGTGVPQTAGGVTRDRQLRFVAWGDEWSTNDFHMTAELEVDGREACVRPDIILFVNGIPFASIELKRPGEPIAEAISQTVRNQKDSHAPRLFVTQQLLVAGRPDEARYATVGTPAKYWSVWKEPSGCHAIPPDRLDAAVNGMVPPDQWEAILADFPAHAPRHNRLAEAGARWVTTLDETLAGLLTPSRALDLARRFTLFDKGVKKVARWQQVSAVLKLLDRVRERDGEGRRAGGVIWHTQGSGKSLTMVMLARALAWKVASPRLVIVTDRKDLDRQIKKTFAACQMEPVQARTGAHLLQLLEDRRPLVTTLINKFRSAVKQRVVTIDDPDTFILVDESHRSQYGDDQSMHEDMRRVFPRACYIGFTGTPLFKDRARNTFLKFGPLIDRYAIEDAVKDGAVLPLVYEGRAVEQDVSDAALDAWFERTSEGLTPQQKGELKTRMSSAKTLATVPARLKMIAWDIREHFLENFAGTGLKGQVVAMNKAAAVRLLAIFDELNEVEGPKVKARVVISGPDAREGHEDVDSEGARGEVQAFWARMMKEFGDEDRYNAAIVEAFDSPDPPDLLIVVSKLLTGFDVQRNSVLYLAQPLKEHNLLQAIARVNRVFEDDDAPPKRFGMIVDYCGVLEDLSGALTSYAALGGYDEADIRGAISSIRDEAAQLPDLHRELLAMFDGISNRFDFEAYAIALADEDLRDRFHRALSAYASALNLALASREFLESEKPERVRRWKADLARFEALRQEARRRYGEAFDWSRYEARVQKLLDEHVTAGDVSVVVEPLDILDETALADALAGQGKRSDASMADEIASKMSRTITERMDQDPAFFGPFSEMVRKTIEAFRQRRIDERAYLERIRELHETAAAHLKGESDDVPAGLLGDGDAIAFWGVVRQELVQAGIAGQAAAERIATVMLGIVKANLRVGWQDDAGAEHGILTAFEDWALDKAPAELGFPLSLEFVDLLAPRLIAVARERLRR